MENKTAVEYLAQQWYDNNLNRLTFKKALEMEKEQIIKSNRDGVDMCVDKKPFILGEQYYSETYKKPTE